LHVDSVVKRLVARMDLQYFFASFNIWTADCDLAVKTARAQKCRIQDIRTVRCSDDDDAFVRAEAIHLDKQLVERLFTLVMSAAKTGAALTSNCIDFIDKDDTWCILLRVLEQITNTRSPDTDEHLNK